MCPGLRVPRRVQDPSLGKCLNNKNQKWIKLSNFSLGQRVLIFFISFVFILIYASSHVKNDFVTVKENSELERQNKIMLDYISILEKATTIQAQEIHHLKNSCN